MTRVLKKKNILYEKLYAFFYTVYIMFTKIEEKIKIEIKIV